MIYLDNNATTQVDPVVLEAALPFLSESYANPSAMYRAGRAAHKAVETAREQVAAMLGASPEEIIFTSGGTEGNNAVISGMKFISTTRRHFVLGVTEHPAVEEPALRWKKEVGAITRIPVDDDGITDLEALRHTITDYTSLLSFMWANNETGVISPMADIVNYAHNVGAMVHTDAVQAAGKLPIDVTALPVDYLTLSGHKIHAMKGVGALYISKRVRFEPWMLGGGQESGRRSGTENVASIVSLGLAAERMALTRAAPIRQMRDAFEEKILQSTGAILNGHWEHRLDNTTSLTFPGLDGAGLLIMLDERGVCCSSGSACHTASLHPSRVLKAMSVSAADAASTLRFSFSRFNTLPQAMEAADIVIDVVKKMRDMSSGGPVIVS